MPWRWLIYTLMINFSQKFSSECRFSLRLFLTALILRLVFVVYLQGHYFFYDYPGSDVFYYQNWADRILAHDPSTREVFWGLPLFPYFLAVLKTFTFNCSPLIHLFNLTLGSFNCVLVYKVGLKIFKDHPVIAKMAGILTATNFILIHYDWLMMPVTLLITLTLLIVYVLLEIEEKPLKEWFYLGLLIGLTILGDGKFMFFFALIALYFIFKERSQLESIFKRVGCLCIGVALIVGGVALRNRIVGGDWILISAQNGLSFYVGNNPQATGIFSVPSFIRPTHEGQDIDQRLIAEGVLKRHLKPSEVTQFWQQRGWQFIKNSPAQYLQLLKNKLIAFFKDNENAYDPDLLFQRNLKKFLNFNPLWMMLPLAIIGLIVSLCRKPKVFLLLFLIISQLIITLIFFLTDRHRATLIPFFILLEASSLYWLWRKIIQHQYVKTIGVLFFVCIFYVIFKPEELPAEDVRAIWLAKAGPVFEKQNKLREARSAYEQLLQKNPNDADALYNLGNVDFKEGNFEKAVVQYEHVMSLAPYYCDALFNMALAYEKLEKKEKAVELFQKVNQLQPASDAYFHLAQIHQAQNNCVLAFEEYQKSIKLNPNLQKKLIPFIDECHSSHSSQ